MCCLQHGLSVCAATCCGHRALLSTCRSSGCRNPCSGKLHWRKPSVSSQLMSDKKQVQRSPQNTCCGLVSPTETWGAAGGLCRSKTLVSRLLAVLFIDVVSLRMYCCWETGSC